MRPSERKKWFLFAFCLWGLVWWRYGQQKNHPEVKLLGEPERLDIGKGPRPVLEKNLISPPRAPASQVTKVPEKELFPTVIEQQDYRWDYEPQLRAISRRERLPPDVKVLGERPGFLLVSAENLPPILKGKTYPLMRRSDSGLMGIYTGVMKVMGPTEQFEEGRFVAECACTIEEKHPDIKVYLLRANGGQDERLQKWLKDKAYFNYLEWEILDRPRTSR
jgi:hypothetical protein